MTPPPEPKPAEGRALVALREDDLLHLLTLSGALTNDCHRVYIPRFNQLPAESRVEGVFYDFSSRSFLIRIVSPNLPPNEECSQLPRLEVISERRVFNVIEALQELGAARAEGSRSEV